MAFFRKQKKGKTTRQNQITTTKPTKKKKLHPAEIKLMAVEATEAGLSPAEVGEIIGTHQTTISNWRRLYFEGGEKALIRKSSNPGSRRICQALELRIEELRRENPEAGVRRIRDELRRHEGLQVSAETVRRVVNDAELGAEPVKPKRKPPQIRRFEREIPNALWQIDIFTFQLKRMYPVYLVGIIDDHSRYIVGHGLFRQQTAEAVLEVVKGAIGQWGAPREILSDNGRQFAAWRGKTQFQKVLKRQGISHVRSAPHHPMTLGKIERFWKTIWTEFLEDAAFASFADARQRLDHWVGYYNHQRPHQGISSACPADRFYGVANDIEEAIKQGCQQNALQLALGQETRPPLYLLGKLGNTDVRVTRKGEDIEVKLGEDVHEVIRTGVPFSLDDEGQFKREEVANEVEKVERRGALPDSGDGQARRGPDQRIMQEFRHESSNVEQGDGEGGYRCDGSVRAEETGPQIQTQGSRPDRGDEPGEDFVGEGTRSVEDEVRHSHDLCRTPTKSFEPRGPSRGGEVGEKKEARQKEFAERWLDTDRGEDGK